MSKCNQRRSILFLLYAFLLGSCLTSCVAALSNDDAESEGVYRAGHYCDATGCIQRNFNFPDVRISLVCHYDFRKTEREQNSSTASADHWPEETISVEDRATYGEFLEYMIHLIPEVSQLYTGDIVGQGLFWTHGGEGEPGWEIPACGTNRTQGVLNLRYFSVLLNLTESDDFELGESYVHSYFNENSIRHGIEEYICSDLDRVYVGVGGQYDESDFQYHYPNPEEICPRVSSDTVWDDWQGYLLLALLLFLAAVVGVLLGRLWFRRRLFPTTNDNNKPSSQQDGPDV